MNFRKGLLILGVVALLAVGGYIYWQNRPRPALETKFVPSLAKPSSAQAGPPKGQAEFMDIKTPPESANLGSLNHAYQTFNNCGPATLSMILGWFGTKVGQKELGDKMRPYQIASGDNDDKSIFTDEFVKWAKSYGLEAMARPNGDINTLKKFTANGIPVVVKTYLYLNDDIGHFRIVKGYNEGKQVIIQDDSFEGPNREFAYYDFLSLWQPFHYVYIVVYKPEQSDLVEAIIGSEMDEKAAWQNLLTRSESESKLTPESVYPTFNKSVANYYLGNYQETISEYESVADRLPRRMLWYQLEPILAMQELKQYDKIFPLSERILNGGNRAYSELYQIRGEIYLAQNNPEAAKAEFEKAVQYNINYEPARAALADL